MVKKPLPKPLYGGLKVLCDNLNLGLCVHLRRISFLLLRDTSGSLKAMSVFSVRHKSPRDNRQR